MVTSNPFTSIQVTYQVFLTLLPGTGVRVTLQRPPSVSRANHSQQVPPYPIYLVLLACINLYRSLHYSLLPASEGNASDA